VGDISRLTDAEAAIAELEAQAALDLAAATQVKDQIAALPAKAEITLADKTAVVKARTDFDALTSAQKTLVGAISRLTDAETAIAELEAQAALDLAAANQVKDQIAALPAKAEVTLADKTAVVKARMDFNHLTPAQKTLVGDISRLTDAEAAIAELEAQAALDLAAATQVKDQIAALPAKAEVTLADKTTVVKARMDFNHLTPAQKTLVGDISRLTDAEAAIAELELVATAKQNLNVTYNGTEDKVTLPSVQDGAAVTWILKDSVQSSIVNISTGSINRAGLPANTDVVLIATITSGTVSDTKEFTINIQAENIEPESITSKAITNFDFSFEYATQARKESKKITSTDFQSNPKHFTISDGTVTIPVDLTWNIPLNGFSSGQVVGSAVDSFIQDYYNAHGINLGNRTVAGMGFGDTFFITTFKTGSDASITLGGNDWSFFFDNNHYTGTDEDRSKNRTFNVSDGTNTATILLEWEYIDMDDLVSDLNYQLASVSVTTKKVNATQFQLVANSAEITITITGTDKSQFFEN
ncbi:immunoglobulin-like domain-containing protein, partial [Paenibacillus typhae]